MQYFEPQDLSQEGTLPGPVSRLISDLNRDMLTPRPSRLGCRLWHRHSPHIRKVRSITTKEKHSTPAHSGTDTPGYLKYLPYSSLSAPPAATSTPRCNLSVRPAQSQPTAAHSLLSNFPSPSASALSVPTSTSIVSTLSERFLSFQYLDLSLKT